MDGLQRIGLSTDEATIYIKLLGGFSTPLRLSRETGISRSKVYRLVEALEQRGLATHHIDDTGRYIKAANPENLEIKLTAEEERIKEQLHSLTLLVPQLSRLQQADGENTLFSVHTYKGADGFGQMLWHELKTEGEMLVLGGATIEDLAPSPRWAERHRLATITAGYSTRELLNEANWDIPFTAVEAFSDSYIQRRISSAIITLMNQTCIYNDTVAIYHWRHEQKIGIEIINKDYADMMRHIFQHFWQLADERT